MAERFTFFWSGPFSQWDPSPFFVEGVMYNCAEQYMMAEKARLFGDEEMEARIMSATLPSDQKRYGRMVKGFDLKEWEKVARDIVYRGNMAKFSQSEKHRDELFATEGTTLVEASPRDRIWGIGLKANDPRAKDRSKWRGKNWLGDTLTRVRDDLIKQAKAL
jgi:ribA/ribD-fused uncharacterized protein